MDRNQQLIDASKDVIKVALRKESVDRNIQTKDTPKTRKKVALRKESVDRNPENPMIRIDEIPSLSARRAWIEISITRIKTVTGCGRSPQGERG